MDRTIGMARQDHLLARHAEHLEIVGVRNDALMSDAVPVPAEDPLQIARVDVLVVIEGTRQAMARPVLRHEAVDPVAGWRVDVLEIGNDHLKAP